MVVRSTLDLALEYAAQGLRVFPCHEKNEPHAGRSSPYFLKALNFTSWATDASSDPARVRELFTQFPNAMIGIAMGYGRFALDIDIKTVDGWASLAALGIKIPVDAPRIRTASGGSHVIFLLPDFPIGNWVGQVGPGLDIKTDGGYVIAAGSVRDDGPYEWVVGASYLEAVAAPPALIARLREISEEKARRSEAPAGEHRSDPAAGKWARAALDAELDKLSRVAPGARNDALNATAFVLGQIVGGGYLDINIVRARLYDIAVAIGLDNSEIPGTIRSGLEDGMAKPRHPGERPGGNSYDAEGFTAADPEPQPPPGDGAPPHTEAPQWGPQRKPAEEQIPGPPLLSSAEFMAGLRPPQWLIDGLLTSGFTYTLTGPTGAGKTALALLMALDLAHGHGFAGRECERVPVAFFAGENADNVRIQWYALCKHHGVDPKSLPVHWFAERFPIKRAHDDIVRKLAGIEDLGMVIIDSLQAYFVGDDDNANLQMLETAVELRRFTLEHPARPSGMILAHPVKNAGKDNLLPRGGSSVTNELDGNLTLWLDPETDVIELHWAGKWRGPPFEPMSFEVLQVQPEGLVSAKGKQMSCGVVQSLSGAAVAEKRERLLSDDEIALTAIRANAELTHEELARILGKKSRASGARTKDRLLKQKLIRRQGRGYVLTKAGITTLDGEE
jgi:hypothetical protein